MIKLQADSPYYFPGETATITLEVMDHEPELGDVTLESPLTTEDHVTEIEPMKKWEITVSDPQNMEQTVTISKEYAAG